MRTHLSLRLDQHYASLEKRFDVQVNPAYERLVVANGNGSEPIHRWFHLKEAFAAQFLPQVLTDLRLMGARGIRILDPFSGIGTSAVSVAMLAQGGQLHQPMVDGIEVNPFLQLVASTKLRVCQNPPVVFDDLSHYVAASALKSKQNGHIPELSTFHNNRYFSRESLTILLRLRAAIDLWCPDNENTLTKSMCEIALARTLGDIANLRKDGRALRYVPKDSSLHPIDLFLSHCEMMQQDAPRRPINILGEILRGDGTDMSSLRSVGDHYDLIVYSPPYPNNIDYTEVYKLEAWFLGLIGNSREFRRQRSLTMHSHPSVARGERLNTAQICDDVKSELLQLCEPIVTALPSDRYRRSRVAVIEGYVLDTFRTLENARRRLRVGGHLVVVVGNSAHGPRTRPVALAADLIVAVCGKIAGLTVEQLAVARYPARRRANSHWLRETVIFMSK